MESGEQLFRRESGRIVAALSRIFGLANVALAEDVAQDVFCRAIEVWRLRGIPPNPSAWLMKAAKNRAIDVLRRERTARNCEPELRRLLSSEWTMVSTVNDLFSAETIQDDQLRMMFSCCDPALPEETQVALILRLCCGFNAAEIAAAFLIKRSTVEKRIERGRVVLAKSQSLFDVSQEDLRERVTAVHRALYLLFNEGYHGASAENAVRTELCREAMRLASSLLDNPLLSSPVAYALCALMWLDAGRLPARLDEGRNLVSLFEQDRALWNRKLIARGNEFLDRAAAGNVVSEYHLEAAIAAVHSNAERAEDTDWIRLVWLYDVLLDLRPSPVIALNRAIAMAQTYGAQRGIDEIRAIPERDRLALYPFFHAALGELEGRAGNAEDAHRHFEEAASLARNPAERRFLQQRAQAAAHGL